MPTHSGRIFDIIKFKTFSKTTNSENECVQIVLRKKDRGKNGYLAINYWGFWKDKIEELDLRQKDKIRTNFSIKSRKINDKYLSDIVGHELVVLEKAPLKIDYKTGELF